MFGGPGPMDPRCVTKGRKKQRSASEILLNGVWCGGGRGWGCESRELAEDASRRWGGRVTLLISRRGVIVP